MTKATIIPVQSDGAVFYHASSGGRDSVGRTAGEALDALIAQLPDDAAGTLIDFAGGRAGENRSADDNATK